MNFRSPPLPAALAPLQDRVFRMLWLAWLTANMCMWMNDVAAAWLMSQLTDRALLVALVQTASTLPVFLLGLPSGALADILDRRRWFAATQLWVAAVAVVLAVLATLDLLSAPVLLVLIFANGIGLAMRWPVFAAIIPEVVPRERLQTAMGLNAVAMNLSRIVGPVVAGALLALAGNAAVFALNAVLSTIACALVLQWRTTPRTAALPGERFVGAMRVGLQFVRQSPRMRAVNLRLFLFFLQATGVFALLPLRARGLGGGAGTYTLLIASMGAGAIVSALAVVPRVRTHSRDRMVDVSTVVYALAALLVAFGPVTWVVMLAMAVAGLAWILAANTLLLSAQLSLPGWVRARGMSIAQMALMGGSAAGAALWGQIATLTGVAESIAASAVFGVAALALARRARIQGEVEDDTRPVPRLRDPEIAAPVDPDEGPVMVTIEYEFDPAESDRFTPVMEATRSARLRLGVLSWGFFRDVAAPGRYIEYFVDESWVAHLRRLERFTADDMQLREQRLALHRGAGPPVVRRYVGQRLVG